MRNRPLTLLAGALATALLAAGCATVPTQGPIRNSSQDAPASGSAGIAVEARPPRPNAEPLALVNGFLEAMSDSRAFDVAREYMTPVAAGSWKPEARIWVFDQTSGPGVSVGADEKVHLSAPLIATIDSRGSWTPAPAGQSVNFVFELVQVSKQWRVAKAPPGVFLGSNQLQTQLAPQALYFFNPSKKLLVADPVFLPIKGAGQMATQLVQELLKGPTSRLGNSVVSAAPPGTTVNVSVPVESGVATVALSGTAASLTDTLDRERLAAQITWTLRPVTNRVRITVDGAPLLPDQSDDELSFSTHFGQYDPSVPGGQMKNLFGLRDGKIQRIPQGQDGSQPIEPQPLTDSPLYAFDAKSFAVNLLGDSGAIVTATKNGTPAVVYGRLDTPRNEQPTTMIPVEGKVLRPSYDNDANLWILDRADSSKPRLRVRGTDGKLTQVQTKFDGATPVVLRMAPDGVRALLVMQSNGVNSVQTATIERAEGDQLVLGRFKPLQLRLSDITDATWSNLGILVAGKAAKGENEARPWQVNVDGSYQRGLPGASSQFNAIHVAANPNLDTLPAVQDATGQLHWQGKDLNWVDLEGAEGKISPVYPG